MSDIIKDIYYTINGKEEGEKLRLKHLKQVKMMEEGKVDFIILDK